MYPSHPTPTSSPLPNRLVVTCLVAVKVRATSPNVSSEHPSKRRVARTAPVRCTTGSLPGSGRSFRPSFAARPSPAASQPLVRPASLSPFVLRPPLTLSSSPRRRGIVRHWHRRRHHPVHRPSMPGELEPLPRHHCLHPPSRRLRLRLSLRLRHRHRHRLPHCYPTVYPRPRSVRLIWRRLGSIAAYPVASAASPPLCCRRNSIYPWCTRQSPTKSAQTPLPRVEIGLIAPFALDALQNRHYGKYRSRSHSSATALHHVFTTVYGTWGDGRTTAATAPTESESTRTKARWLNSGVYSNYLQLEISTVPPPGAI